MSVISTIEVPAEAFTLGAALAVHPGVSIRLERVVPLGETFIPYVWITGGGEGVEDVEAALRANSDVRAVRVVDTVDDEALVRLEWEKGIDGVLDAVVENEATILEAVGENDRWTMQLRFDDHADLTAFYRQCVERGLRIDLRSVHNPGLPERSGLGSDLTDTQYETLVTAFDAGYFEVPRRINLTELAAEIGVSDTAVSQRLRRGIATLLSTTLAEDERDPASDGG
ncbi:MAG: helix-turn-helix domain-containing protein [Haloferacaceae archaeon]